MVSCGRPAATPGSRRRRHPRSRPASLAAADADADAAAADARGEWSRVSMMVRKAARKHARARCAQYQRSLRTLCAYAHE